MKEIVRASIEDCSQIERFRLVTRLGNAILSNGGEVFRAEQAMEYAARALRLEAFNAYVIANGLFSNVVIAGRFYSSRICYVPLAPTILCRVDALNDLSRKIAAGKCGPYEMRMRLEQIEHMKVLENRGKVLAAGIGSAGFCYLPGQPARYGGGICGGSAAVFVPFIRSSALFFVPDDADDHDEQRACIVLLFAVLDRAGRKPGSCHDRSCVHAGAGCAADQFDPEFFGK